jgi:hypothetical protein
VQAPPDSLARLVRNEDFIVAHEFDETTDRTEKIPFAVAIIAGVVALPALNLLPIVASALAGVVAMVFTGVLEPTELYSSVEWNVISLPVLSRSCPNFRTTEISFCERARTSRSGRPAL